MYLEQEPHQSRQQNLIETALKEKPASSDIWNALKMNTTAPQRPESDSIAREIIAKLSTADDLLTPEQRNNQVLALIDAFADKNDTIPCQQTIENDFDFEENIPTDVDELLEQKHDEALAIMKALSD